MQIRKKITTVTYDVSISTDEALAIIAALRTVTKRDENKSNLKRDQEHLLDVFVEMVND